jgi:hypothetical protein
LKQGENEMTKRTAALASTIVLVLALVSFVGSALAADGHGNAKGAEQSPGNSANAPGQIRNDEVSTPASADANADASQSGVKPTTATAHGNHNTSCSTGGGSGSSATCTSSGASAATVQTAAHADSSKRYGSGTTAAQIANGNGAPAGTNVYGPGNSQPHKVTDCKHKHAVDVHAVKSYSSAACTQSTGGSTRTSTSTSVTATSSTSVTATGSVAGTTTSAASATGSTQQGSVLGTTASTGKGHGNAGPQGGVLGAIAAVGQGSLPFTGFPLWIAVAAALAVIALGVTLRRQSRVIA